MKRKLSFRDDINGQEASKATCPESDGATQKPTWAWPSQRRYGRDAAIVFIGPRATGTSSLAVIAASIQGWRVIDCDSHFQEATGSTKQEYRSAHGVEQYRRQKLQVVQEVLETNTKNCVFACGPIIARERTDFLMKYAIHHPVVYVTRERELIQNYLGLIDDGGWQRALDYMHLFFRQRSNFEFFNLNEAQEPLWQTTLAQFLEKRSQEPAAYPQILRKTRAHVSLLLQNVYGPLSAINYQGNSRVFSPSDLEWRRGSHVLCIDLADMKSRPGFIYTLDTGYDAVQLRISNHRGEWQSLLPQDTLAWAVATLRRHFEVPVIVDVNCVGSSKDSASRSNLKAYLNLLQLVLRLAPEYITIDLRTQDDAFKEIVKARGFTKIIGCHYVDQSLEDMWNDETMISMYHRARELGCDVVSISCCCQSLNDNIRCRQVSKMIEDLGLPTPVIAFNTGSLGRLSQVLNDRMTPVIAGHQDEDSNRGLNAVYSLATSRQLRVAWHMLVSDSRTKYYVFGAEVKQSLSPAMHNAGFSCQGLPYTYEACESATFDLLDKISAEDSFGGASISLPFKSEVLRLATTHSAAVKLIGAANTLLPDRKFCARRNSHQTTLKTLSGKSQLIAENTDWMGIYVCIAKHCTPANHITKHTSALVIGAGGMARAAIYALVRLGVGNIFILNRTTANAWKMKEHFESIGDGLERSDRQSSPTVPSFHVLESHVQPWPDGISLPSVVVVATPVRDGESTKEYPPELRHNWFGNATGGLIADLSWKRRATALGEQLREAKPQGWVRIDSIEILYEQGVAQFELFTNCKAPRQAMLDAFLNQYNSTFGVWSGSSGEETINVTV
ncbi:uncharacterized protein Z520_02664 [Fonsecaea multimorphosa CBS 102226]|uniref:Uncharacterized protein n=1 Tax=Fonsecaea multimorphosa CBS 102226 TaxID=1442371 RepID=A0A0D2IVM6_9EURO|nr:uncharacterized protein Z520_02664 [Fonsecaea multimorphosa CBS 102226]KIY01112.1 hypothetical protein Z520_02664 [Fonsecaea multimorphosa CBS 102226]OAL28733.1 hypothetical protein AYO22_02598 [Fonsecaea multimorphosa]